MTNTKSNFIKHLNKSEKLVESWPEYKKGVDTVEFKHAGLVLDALLKQKRVGQISLALDTGISSKTINMICKGNTKHISAEIAAKLEHYFPVKPAEYWLELDMKHQLFKARKKLQVEVDKEKIQADKFLSELDKET